MTIPAVCTASLRTRDGVLVPEVKCGQPAEHEVADTCAAPGRKMPRKPVAVTVAVTGPAFTFVTTVATEKA